MYGEVHWKAQGGSMSDPQPVSDFVATCQALLNKITNEGLPQQARDDAKRELAALIQKNRETKR
jgi:hypothetical protein